MNLKNIPMKGFVLSCLISTFLIACSASERTSSNSSSTVTNNTTNPNTFQNTVRVPQNNQRQIVVVPEPEPELTKQQLFSGVLDAHNRIRAKHGLNPLKWSNKLASYSQEWANHLGRGQTCQMYHRPGQPQFGENLYISSAKVWSSGGREVSREKNNVTIRDVVKKWTDEERWYNYNSNSCQPGQQCGHYTQVVWRNTTEVGCAVKFCPDKSQNWVCSYNPPGNFIGQRPY